MKRLMSLACQAVTAPWRAIAVARLVARNLRAVPEFAPPEDDGGPRRR